MSNEIIKPPCLSLHYNGANSYLLMVQKLLNSKKKDSEIAATLLCIVNISEDFSADNMKKAGWYGYIYDFSVDYDAISIDNILDIHEYLMKKDIIV